MASVSTGGFVYRAGKRGLDVQTTSGQHVGPGTYDSLPSPSRAGTGAFGTMERKLLENNAMSAYTPGPGAYQAAQALDATGAKHPASLNYSAPFASATARLHSDKTHVGLPGPGAYTQSGEWVKHSHRFTAPPSTQRVDYKRVPSAPSIPYRHQCYGYEEGQAGNLVMQPPPDPILTGVGRDTVGPGAYDVLHASIEQPKAVAFGASKTTRGMKVNSTTPGPGQYDVHKAGNGTANGIVVNIAGVDVQFGGAQGSSQFASKVPISSQRHLQEWDRTPGPGAYNLSGSLGSAPLPKELQFFGSSTRRGSQVDPTSSLSAPSYVASPGPAAYNVATGSVRVRQQALTDAKPFNSSTGRFHSHSNGIPGPGEYRPDLSHNLAKTVADKAAISKGGVFGSATDRWAQSSKQESKAAKLPGPADYTGAIPVHKPVHKGHAAAFASRGDRFKATAACQTAPDLHDPNQEPGSSVKGDPARMGPGLYNLPDQWGKYKGQRHALPAAAPGFGSTGARYDPARRANNPGPGRYNLLKDVSAALRPLTVPSQENVFGSQVARFKGPGSYTPGPGHYNTGSDLTRKSYNVTYSGIMV